MEFETLPTDADLDPFVNLEWYYDKIDDGKYAIDVAGSYFSHLCRLSCINKDRCKLTTDDFGVLYNGTNFTNSARGNALCVLAGDTYNSNANISNITTMDVIAAAQRSFHGTEGLVTGNNIYAMASETIVQSEVESNGYGNIYCMGYDSCYGDGDTSISFGTNLFCIGGYYACAQNIIFGISNIYLFGFKAGDSTDIYSNYTISNSTYIYVDGYQAGTNMNIFCESGHTCIVYCFDTALACIDDSVTWYCQEESICEVLLYEYIAPETTAGAEPIATIDTTNGVVVTETTYINTGETTSSIDESDSEGSESDDARSLYRDVNVAFLFSLLSLVCFFLQ